MSSTKSRREDQLQLHDTASLEDSLDVKGLHRAVTDARAVATLTNCHKLADATCTTCVSILMVSIAAGSRAKRSKQDMARDMDLFLPLF